MTGIRHLSAAALAIACLGGPVIAQTATGAANGTARAVNADTLAVGTTYVFLFGIESVERTQLCEIAGQPWQCYPAAVRALENIVGLSEVSCTLYGEPDYLGRWLGTCFVNGINVNEALVRAGFAIAKRDETLDYVPAEDAARAERVGLWQGFFQPPAEHRAAEGITLDRP